MPHFCLAAHRKRLYRISQAVLGLPTASIGHVRRSPVSSLLYLTPIQSGSTRDRPGSFWSESKHLRPWHAVKPASVPGRAVSGLKPLGTRPRTMCFRFASGCSGVGFASPAPDFRRTRSVLDFIVVDLRLALGSSSERDDAVFTFSLLASELRGGALARRRF